MKKSIPEFRFSDSLYFLWKSYFVLFLIFFMASTKAFSQIEIQITEIFSGQAGDDLTVDWFEIKNVGNTAWVSGVDPDLYYDDESAAPADADLIQGLSDLQPDESAIILISGDPNDVVIFQGVWSPVIDLNGIEIGYTDGAGLGGGGDAVNIWIGDPNSTSPVDTESYPDTGANDGQSYDVELAAFSIVGNANGAVQTIAMGGTNGDVPNIGSPGNQGPVVIDPNSPVITGDELNAAPYLNITANGPSPICSDLNDPTDPVQTLGIPLNLSDADTPLGDITLTAESNNQSVVPDMNLVFSGMDGDRTLTITPVGVGYSTITITATDTDGKMGTYTLNLAVSDATIDPATSRFHVGASDGSTALAVDDDYFWVGDDEGQTIRLFDRNNSGLPIYSKDFNNDLNSSNEIDIESSFRNDTVLYWMGSHTNAERAVIFSAIESGNGAGATLTYSGYYDNLLTDLADWDSNNEHGMGANFYGLSTSIEIEAMAADPNNADGALVAFRSPQIDGNALILPISNFQDIVVSEPGSRKCYFWYTYRT